MKRIPVIMIFLSLVLYGKAENPPSDKDKAVACIKRWEGWHRGKMPYIGYGHRLALLPSAFSLLQQAIITR